MTNRAFAVELPCTLTTLLNEEFSDLEAEGKVEQELAELKQRLHNQRNAG